ncbi:MAG: glycosyltransferase family 2 protein [Acidobacteriota bacterium]
MKGMVSIIVISWDSIGFLGECLKSVREQTYQDWELIVVDNGSQDGSADLVREKFPEARLIANSQNLGFSRAGNLGLRESRGKWVLFINPDVRLERDWLEKALPAFKISPRVGMVTGKILRFDRSTIDSTGQFLSRSRRAIERGYNQPDRGQYDQQGFVFSVCGAVALYRREMVEALRLNGAFLDEDFFAFYEDLDVGWRANLLGWRGYYVPDAVAYHYRGGSQKGGGWLARFSQLSQRPTEIKFHIVKNRYLTIIKNDRWGKTLLYLPYVLGIDALLCLYLLVADPKVVGKLLTAGSYFKAAFRKRKCLREMLKKTMCSQVKGGAWDISGQD